MICLVPLVKGRFPYQGKCLCSRQKGSETMSRSTKGDSIYKSLRLCLAANPPPFHKGGNRDKFLLLLTFYNCII